MNELIVIDQGNTNTKFTRFKNGKASTVVTISTKLAMSQKSLAIVAHPDAPVALSSVVTKGAKKIARICKREGRRLIQINCHDQKTINCHGKFVGSDLVAAAAAALESYRDGDRDLYVIGLGTATTLTCVSSTGELRNVYFYPGLAKTLEALVGNCDLLPGMSPELFGKVEKIGLGTDDQSAIIYGILGYYGSGLDGWVAKVREQLGRPAVVLATGGWSATMDKHTKAFDAVDSNLTLRGIYLLAQEALRADRSKTTRRASRRQIA